ncbi:MAG: hypothetical protein JXR68_02245 [Bacteroidales bacterium]|nr:hypothetical protein [Bacteroidales bacterium]
MTAILTLSIIFVGCEKQELTKTTDVEDLDLSTYEHEVFFFIDNIQATDFDGYPDGLMIVVRDILDKENETIITENYGFTSEEGYVNFGIENNYPLKEELDYVKQMRTYIVENGVEEYYENNGELPEGYIEFEENLHEAIFTENKNIPSLLLGLLLAEKKWGFGGHWIAFVKTWPVMLPGWDNDVSSYKPIGLAGVVSFYGRTFYRDRLFTKVQWAEKWYNMSWYNCDNALSSWFRI